MSTLIGSQALANGVGTGTVNFPVPFAGKPDIVLGVTNTVDASPAVGGIPIVTSYIGTVGNYTGFTFKLTQNTNSVNYALIYALNRETDSTAYSGLATLGIRMTETPVKYAPELTDLIPLVNMASAVKQTNHVRVSDLRNILAGVMAVTPTDSNSDALPLEFAIVGSPPGPCYLAVGVGGNKVGRVALNIGTWNTLDQPGVRQRFTHSLVNGAENGTVTFATPFAGAPNDIPTVLHSTAINEVDASVELISVAVTQVTYTGFTYRCSAPPTGNYVLTGEAIQEL